MVSIQHISLCGVGAGDNHAALRGDVKKTRQDARASVSDSRLSKAVDYLLENENRYYGDWSETVGRGVKPSGWSFQRANKFYPNIDDTAVAIVALLKYRDALPKSDPRAAKISEAIGRAAKWIVAMQSKNGGWAAFDRDNTTELVTKIPFCDIGTFYKLVSA